MRREIPELILYWTNPRISPNWSRGDTVSHVKFREKYNLNFPLLSDDKGRVTEAYGVWKKKNLYGREYFGIERTTFLIDEGGKVARIWPKVHVEGHTDEVLAAL